MNVDTRVSCFICHQEFLIDYVGTSFNDLNSFEKHLLKQHHVLIPKFNTIGDLLIFCSQIKCFKRLQLDGRCFDFLMNRFDKSIVYHIVDKEKIDKEDDTLVKNLIENDFLSTILDQAESERNATDFNRMCLFCKKVFTENRSLLFDHLFHDHNFFIGHPNNIINANEFLDELDSKLRNLKCLYCEKDFKSWNVLKEHMRKKGHKVLNPNNHEYDRFYLINYLCNDKHWQQIKKENDFYLDNFNDDWCDWIEDDLVDCLCFFCPYKNKVDNVKQHMLDNHSFDFTAIVRLEDFYDRIKVVNYIRKCSLAKMCFSCSAQCHDTESLQNHLSASNHSASLPNKQLFDSFEFFFPTYEDDGFLLFLDEFNDLSTST